MLEMPPPHPVYLNLNSQLVYKIEYVLMIKYPLSFVNAISAAFPYNRGKRTLGEKVGFVMSVKKEIMAQLKQEILSLTLTPGTIVSETALAERFQLSRTPIRDILKQLSLEGYLNIYPKKGNIVSYIDLEAVEQIIFLRSVLEKEIMKALAGHLPLKGQHDLRENLERQRENIERGEGADAFLVLDDTFHQTLFALAGREFLWKLVQHFNVHYIRYRKLHMQREEKLLTIHDEHRQLLGHIIAGEREAIEALLHRHLRADIDSAQFERNFGAYLQSE